MAEMLTEVTVVRTRDGKLISRTERQVPDDGTFDRGAPGCCSTWFTRTMPRR
jgi:hypothetical protein